MIRLKALVFSLVLCTILGNHAAHLQADDEFKPVSVSDGPLLFFFHAESADGNPFSDWNDRIDVLYVFDPRLHQEPQRLWHGVGWPRAEPIARLGRGVIVMSFGDRTFFLDLKTGKSTDLLETKNPTEVISVEGNIVYFVESQTQNESTGLRQGTDEKDQTVVVDDVERRDVLFVLDWSKSGSAKQLADVGIETILVEDDQFFWVVTAARDGHARYLSKISKTGNVEELFPFPDKWDSDLTRFALSPNKALLALTSGLEEIDFHSEQDLIVIDLKKKKIVYSRKEIKPKFHMFGGYPFLSMTWLEDGLFWIEFETVDTETWKEPTKERLARSYSSHSADTPLEKDRKTIGHFDLKHGLAYFQGKQEPVASVLNKSGVQTSDLVVDEKGDWVVFVSPKDGKMYLVDGKAQKKRRLISSWSHYLVWLPTQQHRYR